MTTSPNSTAHWMFVDEEQIEQPLTHKDREDLARFGSELLIKRLWIRAAAALLGGCGAIAAVLLIVTQPVEVCLMLAVGLILFAVAAGNASRVRRIEAALNVEFVVRNDSLDPDQPRIRRDRVDLPAQATGTLGRGPDRWRGRRARH